MRHSLRSRARLIQRLVPALLVSASTAALGADAATRVTGEWPQWRGPGRDSSATRLQVPDSWPAQLREVWSAEVGPSDAGPVVAGGKVYTFTRSGDREVTTALDLETGAVVWQESYEAPFKPMVMVGIHGAGPYSTPLVEGGKLFTLGISQVLTARDAATGKELWRRGFDSEFKITQPFYGNSLSPILVDGKLVLEVGGGGNGRGARGRSGHGQGRLAAAGRRPGVRLADRGRHRGHPADRHPHPEASDRRRGGDRQAAVGDAVPGRHRQHRAHAASTTRVF